ncbi:MAG: alpha/beta hydrolase [Bacteroidetes bacterium]|nr:alpha/beta hydrolase [Bacteroidota bacterium]
MKQIQLYNGCKIAYTDVGQGHHTLLLVHGLGVMGSTWQKNIKTLQANYRCIALDLPGNGHSSTGHYPYSMDFYSDCLLDFIGRLGLQNLCLVGHSMGGQIALTAVLKQKECCERLVLISPAGFEQFSFWERQFFNLSLGGMSFFSSNVQAIQQLVHSSFYQFPEDALHFEDELIQLMKAQPSGHYRNMCQRSISAMLNEPVFEQLPEIKQQTLVIFGENDRLIPNTLLHPVSTKNIAEQGIAQMPNAQLHIISQAGHFVQWEKAADLNKLILAWLPINKRQATST